MNLFNFIIWPEMVLWPYLIDNGWLPYRDIAMAHNPLLVLALAGWNIDPVFKVKLFTILLLLLSGALIYKVTRSWLSVVVWTGLWTIFGGMGLWFESLIAPLALILYLLIKNKSWFIAGTVFALMFLTKQTAIWFLLPIIISKSTKNFYLGLLIPILIFVFGIWHLAIWEDYWWWAVKFGIGILPTADGQMKLPTINNLILVALTLIPGIVGLGRKNWKLVLWTLAGMAGTWPRWEYFHLQPGLPFVAWGISFLPNKWKIISGLLIFLTLGMFISRNSNKPDRFVEPQILEASRYINQHTQFTDTIFVWNTWDNLYALSDRLPATRPWIPQLPWYVSLPGVLEQIQNDLIRNKPRMIIVTGSPDLPSLKELLVREYKQTTIIGDLIIYQNRI